MKRQGSQQAALEGLGFMVLEVHVTYWCSLFDLYPVRKAYDNLKIFLPNKPDTESIPTSSLPLYQSIYTTAFIVMSPQTSQTLSRHLCG